MSYLVAGAWHFAAALAFAVAFGVLCGGEALFWLHRWEFILPLVVSSCALFPVPQSWAKKGLAKFLHYPLPDWDVLLLGPASHRHWLSHSAILPLLLLAAAWRYPALLNDVLPARPVAAGLCAGIGSHLFWDCVGSRSHKIVIVPYWFALREAASRLYLLSGAATAVVIGLYLAMPAEAPAARFFRRHIAPQFGQSMERNVPIKVTNGRSPQAPNDAPLR